MQKFIILSVICCGLIACTPKSDKFNAASVHEVHATNENGVEVITKYVGSNVITVHDTVDNTLSSEEMAAVMAIRNGKRANVPTLVANQTEAKDVQPENVQAPKTAVLATICKGTTKQGQPCKRHTKDVSGYCFNHNH